MMVVNSNQVVKQVQLKLFPINHIYQVSIIENFKSENFDSLCFVIVYFSWFRYKSETLGYFTDIKLKLNVPESLLRRS